MEEEVLETLKKIEVHLGVMLFLQSTEEYYSSLEELSEAYKKWYGQPKSS